MCKFAGKMVEYFTNVNRRVLCGATDYGRWSFNADSGRRLLFQSLDWPTIPFSASGQRLRSRGSYRRYNARYCLPFTPQLALLRNPLDRLSIDVVYWRTTGWYNRRGGTAHPCAGRRSSGPRSCGSSDRRRLTTYYAAADWRMRAVHVRT